MNFRKFFLTEVGEHKIYTSGKCMGTRSMWKIIISVWCVLVIAVFGCSRRIRRWRVCPEGCAAGLARAFDLSPAELGAAQSLPLALIPAIKESNDRHRGWNLRKVRAVLAGRTDATVAVLGLNILARVLTRNKN